MPINKTVAIQRSVGRGGSNGEADVRAIQEQLNGQMNPPRRKLAVDGKVGPMTIGMIRDFQRNVAGMKWPDGRVDPAQRTLRYLNDPMSEGVWARMSICPAPPPNPPRPAPNSELPAEKRSKALLEEAAAEEGMGRDFDAMAAEFFDSNLPVIKSILGTIQTAEHARALVKGSMALRQIGFAWGDIKQIVIALHKPGAPERLSLFMQKVGQPGSPIARNLGRLARGAQGIAYVITAIECYQKWADGDYLYAASELYKIAMGRAVPWAALIDAVQSIVEGLLPERARDSMIFKVLRACDPIGAGAVGVDAMGTLAIGLIDLITKGQMDHGRLDRLVRRMHGGPLRIFAEIGEDLGDAAYEMSQWKSDDWSYAVRAVPGWLRSLVP